MCSESDPLSFKEIKMKNKKILEFRQAVLHGMNFTSDFNVDGPRLEINFQNFKLFSVPCVVLFSQEIGIKSSLI